MNAPQLPLELWDWRPAPPTIEARAEIRRLWAAGYGDTAVARSLNRRAIPTPSGRGRWHPETVRRHADDYARARWAATIRRYRAAQPLRGS